MKFTDSLHDEGINPFIELNKDGALQKKCEELLAKYDEAYDDAVTWALGDYQRLQLMETHPNMVNEFMYAKPREAHMEFELFLYTCIEHLLFCMDLVTAYKYLIQANTDWDYRYFARKIYLLMHESQQMFDNHGKWMQDAKKYLSVSDYHDLDKIRKQLKAYHKRYDESDLELVLNKVDAHRDKLIHTQIDAVQGLSVKRSATIIQEAFTLVVEYADHLIPMISKMVSAVHTISYEEQLD